MKKLFTATMGLIFLVFFSIFVFGQSQPAVPDSIDEDSSHADDIVTYEPEGKNTDSTGIDKDDNADLGDPTVVTKVIVEEFKCEMCDNEDLGRIVAENLRVTIANKEGYQITKLRAHIGVTGTISQELDGLKVRMRFFNYYVNQGGKSKVLTYKTEEDMIHGLDLMYDNLEAFKNALRDLELKKIKADEERKLRAKREEDERLRKLQELEARKTLAYEKFNDVVANMVLVKGGTFTMGYNYLGKPEGPPHKVTLSDYYLDKYPVTNEEFVEYLNKIKTHEIDGKTLIYINYPSSRIIYEDSKYIIKSGYEKHPVVNVTWYGAKYFAEDCFKRLPTEAEWEYAAGGKDHLAWPVGATFDAKNYVYNTNDTQAIGGFEPNSYGIYDMAGNVYEWVNDWYDPSYYKYSPEENPKGPDKGEYKILRGGSWYDTDEDRLMTVFRYMSSPTDRSYTYGFRCAKDTLKEEDIPEKYKTKQ